MLKNRKLEVSVVKKEKDDVTNPSGDQEIFDHKIVAVKEVVEDSITKIGLAVCAYVILDTVRKVVVNTTSK